MTDAATRSFRFILALPAIIAIMAGSSGICHGSQPLSQEETLIEAAYTAADRMERHLGSELDRVMPILSTRFVNLGNPKGEAPFGRLLGGQVASRFSQHGYRVVDLGRSNHPPSVNERTSALAALIQDTQGIPASYEPQAAIVGDYIVSDDVAYVSVRLVRIPDNAILTSCDFSIRLNEALKEIANRVIIPDESLHQQPIQNQVIDARHDTSSNRPTEQEAIGTDPPKETAEQDTEASQDGPFATGTIALNPRNPLAAKLIQARLAELGFYRDRIDGIWKGRSRESLKNFKEEQGLKYTFRWDMATQKALFKGTGQ